MKIWSALGAALLVLVIIAGAGLALTPGSGEAVTPTSVPAANPAFPWDVKVVNLSTEPVPVTGTVTGQFTGDVNVVNEPEVTANQGGTWEVGIAGTPSVKLDGTDNSVKLDPSGNTVQVQNSSTSPLYVNVTNPALAQAREPWGATMEVLLTDTKWEGDDTYKVPAGKWFVIKNVSVSVRMPSSQWISESTLYAGSGFSVLMPPTYKVADPWQWCYINTTPCELYCRPEATLNYHFERAGGSSYEARARVYLTGYVTEAAE